MCEIYFNDLIPEAQNSVLSHFNISSPDDLNLSVIPLAILPDYSDIFNISNLPYETETREEMREAEFELDEMPF